SALEMPSDSDRGETMTNHIDNRKFLTWLTLALILASLWIFKSYLHYILVAAVLALATSHLFEGITGLLTNSNNKGLLHRNKDAIGALILTILFLVMLFVPLLYFISMIYDKAADLDINQIKSTLTAMVDQAVAFCNKVPFLKEPLERIREEGLSLISGPAVDAAFDTTLGFAKGFGNILAQIAWILIFYFLFNIYSSKILRFLAELIPMSYENQSYLYRECTGTVAVVFYGTLFNMVAQGLAFGILMSFVGDYSAFDLGILAGFCSVIPLVGAALVYVPVVALELFQGNIVNVLIILAFTWVVMGFLIDNILRMVFISFLKKLFGFEYQMNDVLILLAILAGIASLGFWGMIIGPSVLALTLAAANLYSSKIDDEGVEIEGTDEDLFSQTTPPNTPEKPSRLTTS
ncbi:MAG: AI-2E family transporter, partial [Desulfocapsaceae bacterium]